MKIYLWHLWEHMRTSFWFVPLIMMFLSALIAIATIWFDLHVHLSAIPLQSWLISASPDNAAGLISTIASSIITVAGVVFSMTMVVLSLASSQLGPRLLRNFIRDPITQIGLGIFTSTFLYCLLILAWLLTLAESNVRLQLSLSIAIFLALACLIMLIRYIHHVAVFIQADTLIQSVSDELCCAIDTLYPDDIHDDNTDFVMNAGIDGSPSRFFIPSLSSGYIQAVDLQKLFLLAKEQVATIELLYQPGNFIIESIPLAIIHHNESPKKTMVKAINQCFIVGDIATPEQDIIFNVRQLEEVALRALSSGINDPRTAIACINRLTIALGLLLRRKLPQKNHYDENQNLCLIVKTLSFEDIADAAFDQIRHNHNHAVSLSLLDSLHLLAKQAIRTIDKYAIEKHAVFVSNACIGSINEPADKAKIETKLKAIRETLQQNATSFTNI
ncbi:DUF2254 domain-containing protein [Photobacterium gaetbulicola]|uniref:DUF2254 domain-containing protein n=1 Tax=Photobacterium gaetbulicola TaxID=1295392 RepID=UPI00068BF5F6|nr:DUF2254 domain-containing protein [Photobacterium gaetbulicola]